MVMVKRIAVASGLLWGILSSRAFADGAICYSAKSAFLSTSPGGWVADYEAARKLGLCVLFHPANYSFDSAPAIIYPNMSEFTKTLPSGELDLQGYIERDLASFKDRGSDLKIQEAPSVTASSGTKFVIRDLLNGPAPNEFEEVAYSSANQAVFLAVYSARKKDEFDKYKDAFREFLLNVNTVDRGALYSIEKENAALDDAKVEGKNFYRIFLAGIGQNFANAMRSCSRPGSKGFNCVLQISSTGRVNEITFENEDETTTCVKKLLTGVSGPKPPFAPFHVSIAMKIH
jgi:hypothetical protein